MLRRAALHLGRVARIDRTYLDPKRRRRPLHLEDAIDVAGGTAILVDWIRGRETRRPAGAGTD